MGIAMETVLAAEVVAGGCCCNRVRLPWALPREAYLRWWGCYNIGYLLLFVLFTADPDTFVLFGTAKRLSYCYAAINCWCLDDAAPDMAPEPP